MNPGWALDKGWEGGSDRPAQGGPLLRLGAGAGTKVKARQDGHHLSLAPPGESDMVCLSSKVVVTSWTPRCAMRRLRPHCPAPTPFYLGHGLHSSFRSFLWAHQNLGVFPQKPWAAQAPRKGLVTRHRAGLTLSKAPKEL